jgi:hypothetical protein
LQPLVLEGAISACVCVEKILAWKTRPVVKLECCEPPPGASSSPSVATVAAGKNPRLSTLHSLEYGEAMALRDKAIVISPLRFGE